MTYLNLREAPLTFKSALEEGQKERRNDTLKLLPYAHALTDFIHECETPMTVGIQGDWGIGSGFPVFGSRSATGGGSELRTFRGIPCTRTSK